MLLRSRPSSCVVVQIHFGLPYAHHSPPPRLLLRDLIELAPSRVAQGFILNKCCQDVGAALDTEVVWS
jgi:hypothetical protein